MDTPAAPPLARTPLHDFGDALRDVFTAVPVTTVRWLFIALLLGLLIWVVTLPRDRVRPPVEAGAGWSSNLKLWAAVALVIQIGIYLIF